jgi:hypothetical protein
VEEADRERYRREAVSINAELTAAIPSRGTEEGELAIWRAYAGTEKLIAVLKFRLDYETPGAFTKLPDASDPEKLLEDATGLLSRSAEEISEGALAESIETLRKARNDLRSYLTERRRSATRAQRRSRRKPSP